MKANELRIGNWVSFDDHLIRHQQITFLKSNADLSNVSPIPLTEEWLIRFGIEIEDKYEDPNFSFADVCYEFRSYPYSVYDDFYHGFLPKLEYVHQFQNLYFALTGEELTLKQ